MASWKDLIDNTLEADFNKPEFNVTGARSKLIKGLGNVEKQFGAVPPSKAPNKWWKAKGKVVAFSPKSGGNPLLLDGDETVYIPSERFPEFVKGLKKAVEAGELDSAIKASTDAAPTSSGARKASTGERHTGPIPEGFALTKSGNLISKEEQERRKAGALKRQATLAAKAKG